MAGEVLVNGERAIKPGTLIQKDARLEVVAPMPFASRGGWKLAAAIEAFSIPIDGKICADVGACTGGFTDVLLQNGARLVYAIDVGYGQLAWKLRQDERVVVMERTNARYLESLPDLASIVTIDVSFISLKLILPVVLNWLSSEGDIIALIKPQFEAGREQVGRGGIIRDPDIHRLVLTDLLNWAENHGLGVWGLIQSPISGTDGNVEFLAWLKAIQPPKTIVSNVIDQVVGKK